MYLCTLVYLARSFANRKYRVSGKIEFVDCAFTARTFQNAYSLFRNSSIPVVKYSNVAAVASTPKFENTLNLPYLPVPKLNQTLQKYLKSVEPFLTEQELANTKKIVCDFEDGIGSKLQKLLEQKALSVENWLDDWWINVAYLDYRDPVVVYSSPGLVFPLEDFKNEDEWLEYTAKLILAAVDYKLHIDNNKIPVDKMGKDPLDMNQYKKVFGTCRIPGLKRDSLEYHPYSHHIIVARNNNYFKLEILNTKHEVPSVRELIGLLQEVLKQSNESGPSVGILTTQNRDTWGKVYQDLLKEQVNQRSVKEIQKSLFLVCLDNPMPKNGNMRTTASKQFVHGGGSRGNAANRWYDKTIQFIVGQDGSVGLTYEHSPSEGQPIAVMTDYLINSIKKNVANALPDTKLDSVPEKLCFNVNDTLNAAINAANVHVDKLVDNLDMNSFQFSLFGKEFVKSQKLSPDSFIQMAMQYAFYRIHKTPGAHYESAATRKYIHGRTETIRSCSNESITFAKTMLNNSKSYNEKVAALKNAIAAHKKYSIEAVNGFGVDRHLLGLKLTAIENGLPVPQLYTDPSFTRSAQMRISSSQVATNCDGFMCYGPLTVDGYGCCYNPRPDDINFGVSAFVEHPDTSATNYREALEASLKDMHDLLVKTQKSKL